jgi:hypothetical protein
MGHVNAPLERTPRWKATMRTVYRAFKELTGEGLKRYSPSIHGD